VKTELKPHTEWGRLTPGSYNMPNLLDSEILTPDELAKALKVRRPAMGTLWAQTLEE